MQNQLTHHPSSSQSQSPNSSKSSSNSNYQNIITTSTLHHSNSKLHQSINQQTQSTLSHADQSSHHPTTTQPGISDFQPHHDHSLNSFPIHSSTITQNHPNSTSTPTTIKGSFDPSPNSITHLIQLYNSHSRSSKFAKELRKRQDEEEERKGLRITIDPVPPRPSNLSSPVEQSNRDFFNLTKRRAPLSPNLFDINDSKLNRLSQLQSINRSAPDLRDQRQSMISVQSFDTAHSNWSDGTPTDDPIQNNIIATRLSPNLSSTPTSSSPRVPGSTQTTAHDDPNQVTIPSPIVPLDSPHNQLGGYYTSVDEPTSPLNSATSSSHSRVLLDLFLQSGIDVDGVGGESDHHLNLADSEIEMSRLETSNSSSSRRSAIRYSPDDKLQDALLQGANDGSHGSHQQWVDHGHIQPIQTRDNATSLDGSPSTTGLESPPHSPGRVVKPRLTLLLTNLPNSSDTTLTAANTKKNNKKLSPTSPTTSNNQPSTTTNTTTTTSTTLATDTSTNSTITPITSNTPLTITPYKTRTRTRTSSITLFTHSSHLNQLNSSPNQNHDLDRSYPRHSNLCSHHHRHQSLTRSESDPTYLFLNDQRPQFDPPPFLPSHSLSSQTHSIHPKQASKLPLIYAMESTDANESPSTLNSSHLEPSTSSCSTPPSSAYQSSNIPPVNNSPNLPKPSNHHHPSSPRSHSSSRQPCAKCGQSMTGQFVRALGTVYHLNCFRCQDCGKVVANKFFPVDRSNSPDCKTQYPLCETDYFRRLGLICAKCGGALRGSYITALDMKFHVEHFTCSVCPTVFGPQDSYYEHSGQVYCHFHYSTRFAVKCTGCQTAILKQFVEINRNNTDEHWHPECYMINKFWNIKLAVSPPNSKKSIQPTEHDPSHALDVNSDTNSNALSSFTTVSSQTAKSPPLPSRLPPLSPDDWRQQEVNESAQSLKEKQKQMEEQVYRIWTVLSTFEESSAACISEMLRHVSSGHYLEGVRMAGKFVLHVETLFAAIDDLDVLFRNKNAPEIAHVREARMLCKKIVNFFSLLSHTHETGARKMNITKELLSLVTGLAHYLKILIRIALTSALKLERQYVDRSGILQFLSRLDRLARDPDASKATHSQPSAQPDRSGVNFNHEKASNPLSSANGKIRAYGYKSLTRALGTMVGKGEATTDLCEACKQTIEEECVRFGTGARWHMACLKCSNCHRTPINYDKSGNSPISTDNQYLNQLAHSNVRRFKLDVQPPRDGTRIKNLHICCEDCSQMAPRSPNSPTMNLREGFESVTRLEQYAFLLCVALNKLYGLLQQRGVLPAAADDSRQVQMNGVERSLFDAYRNSSDIKRMKSVDLDRKLSTTARIPQRSTVVESPSGRVAQTSTEPQYQNGTAQSSLRPNNDPVLRQVNSRSPVGPTRQIQDRQRPNLSHHPRERDLTNLPRSDPPPRPPPTHLNLIPQGSNSVGYHSSSTALSLPSQGDFNKQSHPPNLRPTLARSLTAVKIVEDQPPPNELIVRDEPRLGSSSSPVGRDTAGITLADLPRAMEAEQFREQHKPLPTQVATLSELSALESVIVKHFAALTLASDSSAIKEDTSLDELLEIIEVRKGNFWGKLFKGSNDKAKIKKKGVFSVPLDVLIERHGVDSLLGAGAGQLRVPSFVDDCISAMKQMDMSVEGVFRKNGNIRRLKELTDAIDRDDSNVNFSDDNAVQLAALLKKFLRDLPDPLLTFKLYHLFIASQRVTNDTARRRTLHLICCLLPKAHRDTMEVLFVFLKWVASFSHVDEETGSKMDLQNLATVITPNILYARSKDPTRDESFLAIRAVHELLEYQDEFFQMPPEVHVIMQDQELLNSNLNEITSKDILKRVEALLKLNNGKLRPLGKVTAEHYRGKGEVLPHRPDLHASSMHQQDGDKAEQHQPQNLSQARTGVGMLTHIAPSLSNQHFTSNPNGYPAPPTPSAGSSTPINQQEFVFYPPQNNSNIHLPSPSHQRSSFHRDPLNPSSASTTPQPPASKIPSPHHPSPNPHHPNNNHQSNIQVNPQTAGSLFTSFAGNENNSSSSNNNSNQSHMSQIPVD